MPNKDSDLEPVADLKMAQRYLQYGKDFHEPVSCLLEEADFRFDAVIKSVDTGNLVIEMEMTEESFAKLGAPQLAALDHPQARIRLSYSVNEATFFVHTRFQNRVSRQVRVQALMPMHKLQRRESMRIKVIESHKATVRLGREKHPLFDISAGGLSIVVSLEQEKNYQKHQLFPKSLVSFLGKDIEVDLEVKNVLTHSKDGLKWKVGLRFKALPPMFEQLIAREAYLHSHKIWSRWL